MDFQSLSRKDLQTLCKKNMIPANITNVAMAEALAALQEVAGIEEFLNPIESRSQPFVNNGSPGNPRTACRTSNRRKPVKDEHPTAQSIIRTRRGRFGEMADQENKDLNFSSTPFFPSNRRRAPVPSARKKLETHLIEGKEDEKDQNTGDQKRSEVLETPSMPKTQRKDSVLGSSRRKTEGRMDKSSVQGACSTRRSMRLLEKNMEKLSLMECGSEEPVVADKVFDRLSERKEFCEHKINENGSKLSVTSGVNAFEEDDSKEILGLGIDESDDPEGMNETKDKEEDQANDGKTSKESKEKVQMEENEEDKTITDNEPHNEDQCHPEDKIQSEAAIEEQHAFTPSCNDEFSTENLSEDRDLTGQSPLIQEEANLDVTIQHEVLKEESEIITEEMVEFDIEDLVDINVKEAEFLEVSCQTICNVNALDLISEPKMEVQMLHDGCFMKEVAEFDSGELINVNVMESELVENSIQETYNFEEPKHEDLSKSDELLVDKSSSFITCAVDQIPGQFLPRTVEVLVEDTRTSLEIFNYADQDEDMKNNSNDEERNLSLRQLRKMIKELHLSKKGNQEKTYGKEQVEKVVRTALQPLSENCLAKDGKENTTTANSVFV